MAATILEIADAVVTALNAGSFSQAFTATRQYVVRADLPALATLTVSVVPKGLGISAGTRGRNHDHLYDVDIGIQKKFELGTNAEVDPLTTLVEEVADEFRGVVLTTASSLSVGCIAVANEPIYAPDHMREKRVFTSVLTLSFRARR